MAMMTLIVAGCVVYFVSWNDELNQQAREEAISLISELNQTDASALTIDSADLDTEYGSYAIVVTDIKDAKTYQVAVILNEDQSNINFAIDVTDTYDKYGLAYCH